MTSVSHPLIADIAPARSTNRPDASVREPRRDDEKFSIPEAPQAAKERQEIPTAPVAPVAPVRPRADRAPETNDTAALIHTTGRAAVPETAAASPILSGDAATPPITPVATAPGLIAGIAGTVPGSNSTGQTAAATTTAVQAGSATYAAAATGRPGSTQATAQTPDAQASSAAVNTQQQTGGAAPAGQTNQPVVAAGPAVTTPGAAGTQPPQAAQLAAAAGSVGRTGPGGTTPSAATTSSPATAAGKNAVLDQQSGEGDATGNNVKKPGTDFATGINTAFGSSDAAAKPALPHANTQIMAQAMANAPAIAAATPELTPPSLTAPASVASDALGVTQSFNAEMRAAIDAPTQAAAYTARGAVTAQPAAEQIAMQITRAADQNIDRMTVHLKPGELGKVTIALEVGPDNRLLAVISAERSETLDLLQRDSKSLEKALNDAGIKTDSGSLEFNLKGEGGAAENGRDGDGKLHDGAVMLPGDIDASDAGNIPTYTPLILPEGRIDIQV